MQAYAGGLLQPGGKPGRCFVSKFVGERLCVRWTCVWAAKSKNLRARQPSWKQVGLSRMVNVMWIVPA